MSFIMGFPDTNKPIFLCQKLYAFSSLKLMSKRKPRPVRSNLKWGVGFHGNCFLNGNSSTGRQAGSCVNQRAKLSRLGVETASNSFHLRVSSSGVLAGGIWSVLHGYYCRSS